MNLVRLKCALEPRQLVDRLRYQPEIVEIQLFENDMYRPERIIRVIRMLKKRGIRVYLHHPMRWRGRYLDILSEDPKRRDFYDWSCSILAELCKKEQVKCVVHAHYANTECSRPGFFWLGKKLRKRIERIREEAGDWFLWENTTKGLFSGENPSFIQELVKPLELPLCLDISHSFISLEGDNEKLQQRLAEASPFIQYYHVVDSMGAGHDSLPLGKGKVEWAGVLPFLEGRDYIFEIGLENVLDCTEMVQSAKYLNQLRAATLTSFHGS
ncbi:sugar phosphate isomerase/epimerase [Ammoniphilus sp. CFH 90114]|uniref:sugar phosphate isomerase/epimerase family protein n=1 Tax=Ammoniphilus sp. CFH 90114 TaxID=2493665 RepID=UPI00100E464D|nr:TIM barrel protein [Ammoniphilus sp. CFH 90114]RXT02863.1 sugar phosphate isomerase/epimerase [Ammoniphilus sp. CFH 90114]